MKTLKNQSGYALLILMALLTLAATALAVKTLNNNGNSQIARDKITAAALAQAKDALIGYASTDSTRPGELPCPDVNNDGMITVNVDYSGSNCTSLIGRLPWKTLNLPELRDGSGEHLWYALSNSFHANSSAILNSDTLGTLTVRNSSGNIINNGCTTQGTRCPNPGISDAAFGTGAIAVIFAPGDAMKRQNSVTVQDRSGVGVNTASNYLDIATINGITSDNANFSDGTSSNALIQEVKIYNPTTKVYDSITNDKLAVITHENFFPLIEKAVGKRAAIMLSSQLSSYWGTSIYPFAAPFTNPSNSLYTPTSGTTNGLLPSTATWADIPVYDLSGGSANVSCDLNNGNNSLKNAHSRCSISNIFGLPKITIIGNLNYLGLWRQYDLSNINEVRIRRNGNYYSATDPALAGMSASISYTVNIDSSVTVTFTGNLLSGITRIELQDVVVDSANDWFFNNNWQQLTYYAISPGFMPAGGNTCNPLPSTPSCLTIKGRSGGANKQAILVMTGNALTGHSHPSDNIADYLEGENVTPLDFIYENSTRSSTFNDQVIVIAP